MNRNDYRNHLDKIRCSAEFREKMEERLSSESDGEYEDSVSDIEHAPKIDYHRWTAFAASVLIIIGIGGLVFLSRTDMIDTPVGSDITEDTTVSTQVSITRKPLPNPSSRYNIGISVSGIFNDRMTSIGAVPPELVDRYINELSHWNEFKLDGEPHFLSEPTGAVTLSFTGEDNFTWTIDSNGYAVTKRNGEETSAYYSNICYHSLLRWIARDIPYFDWTYIIDDDKGAEIDKAFKNHINEIEVIGNTDNYDEKNSIRFFECGSFAGVIQRNGNFIIYYNIGDEEFKVCFKSSPELYDEIHEIINNNLVYMISEKDFMFYTNSTGQSADFISFKNINTNALCSAIKDTQWTVKESDYPSGECFGIGNLVILRDGSIYNSNTGFMYTPVNQNNSEIVNAIEEIIQSDDLSYIGYLIASAVSRFDTMSGKVNYSITDYTGGTGELFYKHLNNSSRSEYVYIESIDGNSAEFTMNNGKWAENITKDGVTVTTEDYSVMMKSQIDYENIRSNVLYHLRKASEEDSVINECNIIMEDEFYNLYIDYKFYDYHAVVNVSVDKIGNIVDLTISENKINTYQVINEMTFTLGDGQGGGIVYDDPENQSRTYDLDS